MSSQINGNNATFPGTVTAGEMALTGGGGPAARKVLRSSDAGGNVAWGDELGYLHVSWTPKRSLASSVNTVSFAHPWSVVVSTFAPSEITALALGSAVPITAVTGLQYLTAMTSFQVNSNSIVALDVSGMPLLVTLNLLNNLLTEAAVDAILAALDTNGASGGTVTLNGTGNAAPSAAGLVSKANLVAKSWTVNHN